MTSIRSREYKCYICGQIHRQNYLASSNSLGSMDLDSRPAPMLRNTMHLWIQMCPSCGYVANEISDETTITKDFLKSKKYRTCNGIRFKSNLAKRFYRYYLIGLEDGKYDAAFWSSLRAAWVCDDVRDKSAARICRKQCISLIPKIKSNDEELLVMKSDILRRSGCFEQVIKEFSDKEFNDDLLQKIVAFEVERAKEKDSSVYRVEDINKKITRIRMRKKLKKLIFCMRHNGARRNGKTMTQS